MWLITDCCPYSSFIIPPFNQHLPSAYNMTSTVPGLCVQREAELLCGSCHHAAHNWVKRHTWSNPCTKKCKCAALITITIKQDTELWQYVTEVFDLTGRSGRDLKEMMIEEKTKFYLTSNKLWCGLTFQIIEKNFPFFLHVSDKEEIKDETRALFPSPITFVQRMPEWPKELALHYPLHHHTTEKWYVGISNKEGSCAEVHRWWMVVEGTFCRLLSKGVFSPPQRYQHFTFCIKNLEQAVWHTVWLGVLLRVRRDESAYISHHWCLSSVSKSQEN